MTGRKREKLFVEIISIDSRRETDAHLQGRGLLEASPCRRGAHPLAGTASAVPLVASQRPLVELPWAVELRVIVYGNKVCVGECMGIVLCVSCVFAYCVCVFVRAGE